MLAHCSPIRLTASAYPDRTFGAKLLSIGAVVDPATLTVPLLAETANPGGILKLEMFVRIVIDAKATETALTVPTSAVGDAPGDRDALVEAEAPLRRMAPRRRELTELFEREIA